MRSTGGKTLYGVETKRDDDDNDRNLKLEEESNLKEPLAREIAELAATKISSGCFYGDGGGNGNNDSDDDGPGDDDAPATPPTNQHIDLSTRKLNQIFHQIMENTTQVNPFDAPINSSKEKDRKLYHAAIKEKSTDQKITVKRDTAKKLLEILSHYLARFGSSVLVHNIQVGQNKFCQSCKTCKSSS